MGWNLVAFIQPTTEERCQLAQEAVIGAFRKARIIISQFQEYDPDLLDEDLLRTWFGLIKNRARSE